MRSDSRLFVSILVVAALTAGTALGQSVPGDEIPTSVSTDGVASTSSVVVNDAQARGNTLGVTTNGLNRYSASLSVGTRGAAPVKHASFDVNNRSFPLQQESGSATRTTLYIIGGALVVGGAVAGILALGDGGPDPIPAPPSRP